MSDTRDCLQDVARLITVALPPNTAFVLLAFDYGAGGRLDYVANARREDVRLLLKEFLVKTEGRIGDHLPDNHRERCPTCGQKFGTNP